MVSQHSEFDWDRYFWVRVVDVDSGTENVYIYTYIYIYLYLQYIYCSLELKPASQEKTLVMGILTYTPIWCQKQRP